MATRKYEQRLRAESAEETRRRILDALYELLRKDPTRPPSVDEVARAARVARSTIYVVFGSRSGLFDALTEDLLVGAGYDQLIEAVSRPDAREAMAGSLEGGVHMYAAHRDVFRALRSLVDLDPDATGGAVQRGEAKRAAGIMRVSRRLADQGHLRPDVTAVEAADVIWLLAGFEAFDELYTDRNLPARKVARRLVDMAERTLLR